MRRSRACQRQRFCADGISAHPGSAARPCRVKPYRRPRGCPVPACLPARTLRLKCAEVSSPMAALRTSFPRNEPRSVFPRLGTNDDPGCDPDPKKVFSRFGQQYTIEKYNREWSVYTGGHDAYQIRPFGFVNAYKELYQHNDKFVWVRQRVLRIRRMPNLVPEDLQKSTHSNNRYSDRDVQYLQSIRSEFFELTPPETAKTVRFKESSDGLPTSGSWRNGLTIADMNGDGFPDIIAPPERAGGTGIPAIFLGDGKGHWKYWQEARWPHGLDYGTVAAGDFNKDGHMDLAFAVHLPGIYVMLGDGKGNFTEVSEGLPRDFRDEAADRYRCRQGWLSRHRRHQRRPDRDRRSADRQSPRLLQPRSRQEMGGESTSRLAADPRRRGLPFCRQLQGRQNTPTSSPVTSIRAARTSSI